MTYALGIDAGTTYTAAAVSRDGVVEIVPLGDRAASIPSAVFVAEDGSVIVGEPALRRARSDPQRVALHFKRRIGDATPILVGGAPYSAEALQAELLRWTLETVTRLQGEAPASVVVTHPANWGSFKQDRLQQAIRLADIEGATTLTEPEAAAIHYASNERVEPGSIIGVYDLGGGTFDAAILRKSEDGWETIGSPEGIEQLGGLDFDEAVFGHVRESIAELVADLDPDAPGARAALGRIRDDCVDAKEALSTDSAVSIPVMLPGAHAEVRVTRTEFERMARPTLQNTIGAMRRALGSAGLDAADLSAILLVGGSSRIPLVGELVGTELGRPVAVDAHPKHAVALGAAVAAAQRGGADTSGLDDVPDRRDDARGRDDSSDDDTRRLRVLVGAGAAVVLLAALLGFVAARDGGSGAGTATSTTDASTPVLDVELATGQRVPVGEFPDGIDVDSAGKLWVASTAVAQVTRIDPVTGARDAVALPEGSDPLALAVVADGIWVTLRNHSAVIRLDPVTMETTATVGVPDRPSALGQGPDGSLWVVTGAGELVQIDPGAATVVGSIPVSNPTGVGFTETDAWVAQRAEDAVARIDLDSAELVGAVEVGANPDSVAVDDDGGVWVTNRGEGTLSRIDATTGELTDSISVGTAPADVVATEGRIWLTDNEEGTLVLVDQRRREVVASIAVGPGPLDLAVTDGDVWVSVTADNSVVQVRVSEGDGNGLPAARITEIREEDGVYVVDFDAHEFEPQIDTPDPSTFHVHLFWNDLAVVNAGVNGPSPGQWLVWDQPATVRDQFFAVESRPPGAGAICVIVADRLHGVADVDADGTPDTGTGSCADLPA